MGRGEIIMIFNQLKDGSCDIVFSEEEKKIIMDKGKISLTATGLKHFGNNLMRIVMEFNMNFDEKLMKTGTNENSKVEGIDRDKSK
tara:strand:- start:557 stop:814 length:258 start_codon:yes stop_codon:yes gene_type:complete